MPCGNLVNILNALLNFVLSFSLFLLSACVSVLLSHWDDSHVLWKLSEMKPHIGAVAGGRRRRI